MYDISYFKEYDHGTILAFMQQYPFVILSGVDVHYRPVVTQVPVLIKEKEGTLYLRGHIMKKTDHYEAFRNNPEVLAVFTGPHCYVSASWYSDPKQGSTWNYMTVQARGHIRFLEEDALPTLLHDLTDHFENNPDSPSLYENLPAEYVQRLSKAIVAFEVSVTQTDNVFKLSQNRDEASYHNIIRHLEEGSEDARRIAGEMQQRTGRLFASNT